MPDLAGINDEVLRVRLESVMMLTPKNGNIRGCNGLYLEKQTQTPSGRDKWVKVFGPLVAYTDDAGVTHDDPSYADLLECAARILREQESAQPGRGPEETTDA